MRTALAELAKLDEHVEAIGTEADDARRAADDASSQLEKAREDEETAAQAFRAADEARAAGSDDDASRAGEGAERDLNTTRERLREAEETASRAFETRDVAQAKVALALAAHIRTQAVARGESQDDAVARAAIAAREQADGAGGQAEARQAEADHAESARQQAESEGVAQEDLDQLAKDAKQKRTVAARAAAEASDKREVAEQIDSAERAERLRAEGEALYAGIEVIPASEDSPPDFSERIIFERAGVHGSLTIAGLDEAAPEAVDAFLKRCLPRVNLIAPVEKVPDAVTLRQLRDPAFVFMRGIFHYAELVPGEWEGIFAQTDRTTRRLRDASAVLDKTLRESWTQGSSLEFSLDHDSKSDRIELRILDPNVQNQFVRASRRSSGFTHFFSLKTILNAHQREAPARSYIWLFDEPGIYLHPEGQHDLVQVLETLASTNQVIYSTHSIFMANKNYPARHRLLVKEEVGTKIDGKPFRSRWRPAIEALGFSLPGSLLFASRVLLVEGDSDAILVNALLQKLLEAGAFDRDVNPLAVMATGDVADTAALIRILRESASSPRLAVMFDGDSGGRQRETALRPLLEKFDIPRLVLSPRDTTIEDHLPAAIELYPRATAIFLGKLAEQYENAERGQEEIFTHLTSTLQADVPKTQEGLTRGLGAWARGQGPAIGLGDKLSPVGLAREYAMLLEAEDAGALKAPDTQRAREVARWIADNLGLHGLTLAQEEILSS